jgi:hypothetical protein
MSVFLIGVAILLLGLLLRALLLPLVHGVVVGWTSLYSLGLPSERRDRRRAEIQSSLWEHAKLERELGYSPEVTALHQLALVFAVFPAICRGGWKRCDGRKCDYPSIFDNTCLACLPTFTIGLAASRRLNT